MEEEGNNPAENGAGAGFNRRRRRGEEVSLECAQEQGILQQRAVLPKKEQEEVTWTWKRKQLQGFSAAISLYCRKYVFEDIKLVLTAVGGEKLLQEFLDGCFGHLMHFIGGVNSAKALHELISHEITLPGARDDELWFHISGTNIRFSPAEYALVTGLRFGSSSFDPLGSHEMPQEGVYSRFCDGLPVTVNELWKRFNSEGVHGSAEDYLKVANILALYLMGFGYEERRTIDEWVWVLVEDLDSWNRFPWGAYTYQTLMHYVSFLPTKRKVSGRNYHFKGPVWALQIWAYEAIPHFGNTCASVTGQLTKPRCLKWSFRSAAKINFVGFFEQELDCFETLEPTDEEQLQPYWLSAQIPQPLGIRYTPPLSLVKWEGAGFHVRATSRVAKVPLSLEDTSSVSVSVPLGQPRRSSRLASLPEASYTEPVNPAGVSCRRPKQSWASKRSTSSGAGKRGRPQSVPEWVEAFDEAQLVEQVSSRVVKCLTEPVAEKLIELVAEKLIKPVAEKLIEPVAEMVKQRLIDPVVDQVSSRVVERLIEPVTEKVMEPVSDMVKQRLIEPVVERLSQQLIPHMKQWVEDLFYQTRQSPARKNHPRTPSLAREARDQRKTRKLNTTKKKNKKLRVSSDDEGSEEARDNEGSELPSSSNEETSDDEGSESSSGDER